MKPVDATTPATVSDYYDGWTATAWSRLSLLVPCLNEADKLPAFVARADAALDVTAPTRATTVGRAAPG